ncbi:hypothetical protein Pst134EA_027035 [Puccinia striiformis f. sp. tritici]|uniref:hypothetical protein n=1 Tax=Puccinia striiformis f. sp. tritici TaxID=168172 RepID=UPI002007C253|nr:hypothetical protein Pst134EA_027035 [Puccinia striiformis f. sp. tritici]KAH9450327.1 hypothetical protein Pst134EA_027035 [Puccinia striiformis f. sp. tritici]
MPTRSHKHLACSTPNSSIPSTGVSATPKTTIHVDSRETTPKGDGDEDEEEVVIDDAHNGKNMKIMVGFRIFTDSKNRKKVRIHLPVNSSGHFLVNIKVGETNFPQFRNIVASACSDHFAKTGPVILNSKTVLWWGSIPNVTDWKKSDKNEVHTPSRYAVWLNTACQAKKKSIGLDIKMPDPAAAKKRAAKEDLLAKQEARAAAIKEAATKKRKGASASIRGGDGDGDDDEEGDSDGDSEGDGSGSEIDADEFDDINFHMRKLYKIYPVNVMYNRINPVYIDPGNPQRYILLTLAAVQAWAADLMARKDGVSEKCPPRSLKYLNVSSAKKQKIEASGGGAMLEMVAQFLGGLQGNRGTAVERNEALEEVVHPPNDPTLPAYLDYLGIPDRDHVLEVLTSNGFTSHRSFCSAGLARSEVSALGLNLGTVTALFDHPSAFDNHLSA